MGSVGSNGSPRSRSAIRAVAARGAPVKERAIDTSHEVELVPAEEQKSSFAAPASLSPRCRVAARRCSSRRRSSRARSTSPLAVREPEVFRVRRVGLELDADRVAPTQSGTMHPPSSPTHDRYIHHIRYIHYIRYTRYFTCIHPKWDDASSQFANPRPFACLLP